MEETHIENTTEEVVKEETVNKNTEEKVSDTEQNSSDSESDEQELARLLEAKKKMDEAEEEQMKREREQYVEDAKNNLKIFETWITGNYNSVNLYKLFCDEFDTKYRSDLFGNICDFFRDATFVTDDILFYWKYLAICLLKSSKKYRYYLDELKLDPESKETNLRLVREKYTFRCFIGEEHICYFKENGNDYYVS